MDAGGKPWAFLEAWYRRSELAVRTRAVLGPSLRGFVGLLGARRRALAGWLVIFGVLAWLQGGAALTSLRHTLIPYMVNDDARQQIFPFFRYLEPNAFATDYITDYFLACYPLGYWGLYVSAAWIGIDPTTLSNWLSHFLWLLTVIGLGAVAHELGGKLAAFGAMALALGSDAYLSRIGGGLPRSFGFPILAGTLVGLAYARVWWCAACVLLGALFYPVVGVISGLSLAGFLLLPEAARGSASAWSWRRRLSLLGVTAALSLALIAPSAISSSRFGAAVRPWEVSEFPETGPGGRYTRESRAPFEGFFKSVPSALDEALLGSTDPWSGRARAWLVGDQIRQPRESAHYSALMDLLLLLVPLGGMGLLAQQPAARRVLMVGLASTVGYTVARFVVPYAYLPERYVGYTVPLLGTLAVSTCIAGLFPPAFQQGRRRWAKTAVVGCYVSALLWLLAGRVSADVTVDTDLRSERPLLSHIATLPLDSLVAGWPKGIMSSVPLVTRRRALLTHEVHQVFHRAYLEEMRRRTYALIDAYFATSVEPILRLRDDFGVTHLLVERAHFERKPPRYFKPFDEEIVRRVKAARGAGFELLRQIRAASVFSHGGFELLDLTRIEARTPSDL